MAALHGFWTIVHSSMKKKNKHEKSNQIISHLLFFPLALEKFLTSLDEVPQPGFLATMLRTELLTSCLSQTSIKNTVFKKVYFK